MPLDSHPRPAGLGPAGPLTLAPLAVAAGTAWQVHQPQLWPVAGCVALLALAVGLGLWLAAGARRWLGRGGAGGLARRGVVWVALCMACAALAAGFAGLRADARLAERLPAALEGRELRLTGRVQDLPRISPEGVRFVLGDTQATDAATGQPLAVPPRVWLHWAREGAGSSAPLDASAAPVPTVHAAERWALTVRLRQVHGLMNPGGFDAEGWMFEQGLGAVGSVRARAVLPPQRLEGPRAWQPLDQLDRLRQHLRDAVLLRVADPVSAGVLAALSVGDQSAIPQSAWGVFRDTGVAHLVSISGLHITLFAWLATGVLRRLWPWAPLTWQQRAGPAPVLTRWGGLGLATAYALLAGWGVPAQRTVWMLAAATALLALGRRWPGWLVGLWAAAAVLLADPWALEQAGFWLSFCAVTLLMLSDRPEPPLLARHEAPAQRPPPNTCRLCRTLRAGLKAQAVASVGLAPLTLLLFNQVSVVGALVNLLAVPLVTLVLTPLALGGMLVPVLWELAAALLPPLMQELSAAASLPWAVWQAPGLEGWAAALVLAGGVWVVLPWPSWRWRLLGVPLWWPLFSPLWQPEAGRPPLGHFELLAADVGQGSAVLIRTRHHSLMFDAGPAWPGSGDAGQQVLLPLLRHLGERRLDALVLSHADTDHIGGTRPLLERLSVGRLWASLAPQHPLWRWPLPSGPCLSGQSWAWDGVNFTFLHPLSPEDEARLAAIERSAEARAATGHTHPARPRKARSATNAVSCVLKVRSADGHSALLTGDIEAAQEARLVALDAPALAADVLVAPHHGSGTSSSAEFLAAVHPQWALMQVGYRNRFGHPHPQVLARHQAAGLKVVRTDQAGAIQWRSDGPSNGLICTREVRRRYWHWAQAPDRVASTIEVRPAED